MSIDKFFYFSQNPFFIHAAQLVQFGNCPMFYKYIRDTDTLHGRFVFVVCHKFEDSATHTAFDNSVFDGQDTLEFTSCLMQQLFIQWFQES